MRTAHIPSRSSASFMIPKSCLTKEQIMKIRGHIETANYLLRKHPNVYDFGYEIKECEWNIIETQHSIQGSTGMDNFDMFAFLIAIGVDGGEIHYEPSE
jgi:hypothetical protein